MRRSTFCTLMVGLGLMSLGNSAQAQYYVPHVSTHIDYISHTTTHYDEVRHGNHYDVVPHTTTHLDATPQTMAHFDALPYTSHRVNVGGLSSYQSHRPVIAVPQYSYRPSVLQTTSHLDVVPHHGHVHVVPYTTTRRYR